MENPLPTMDKDKVLAAREQPSARVVVTLEGEPLHQIGGQFHLVDLRATTTIRREKQMAAVFRPAGFRIDGVMAGKSPQPPILQVHDVQFRITIPGQNHRHLLTIRRENGRAVDAGELGQQFPGTGRNILQHDRGPAGFERDVGNASSRPEPSWRT